MKAAVIVALCLVAFASAANIVKLRRNTLSAHADADAEAAAAVGDAEDEKDFWPDHIATYAKHTPLFKSSEWRRDPKTKLYDTLRLQFADKNDYRAAAARFATYANANKALDLTGISIDVNALGGKQLDQWNFADAKYWKADPQEAKEFFKFENGASVVVEWDATTHPDLLNPWLAGVRAGLSILRKYDVQPPATASWVVKLAKWQQAYKRNDAGNALVTDQSTPALADAQAWHWDQSAIILTPGSLSYKEWLNNPFGVADQVLKSLAERAKLKKQPQPPTAELITTRATWNTVHEMAHCLNAQLPASRPVFFETQKSTTRPEVIYGKDHKAPWEVVSAYVMQMSSPREFVAEFATKILADAEGALIRQYSVKKKDMKVVQAYWAFGGEDIVKDNIDALQKKAALKAKAAKKF